MEFNGAFNSFLKFKIPSFYCRNSRIDGNMKAAAVQKIQSYSPGELLYIKNTKTYTWKYAKRQSRLPDTWTCAEPVKCNSPVYCKHAVYQKLHISVLWEWASVEPALLVTQLRRKFYECKSKLSVHCRIYTRDIPQMLEKWYKHFTNRIDNRQQISGPDQHFEINWSGGNKWEKIEKKAENSAKNYVI